MGTSQRYQHQAPLPGRCGMHQSFDEVGFETAQSETASQKPPSSPWNWTCESKFLKHIQYPSKVKEQKHQRMSASSCLSFFHCVGQWIGHLVASHCPNFIILPESSHASPHQIDVASSHRAHHTAVIGAIFVLKYTRDCLLCNWCCLYCIYLHKEMEHNRLHQSHHPLVLLLSLLKLWGWLLHAFAGEELNQPNSQYPDCEGCLSSCPSHKSINCA